MEKCPVHYTLHERHCFMNREQWLPSIKKIAEVSIYEIQDIVYTPLVYRLSSCLIIESEAALIHAKRISLFVNIYIMELLLYKLIMNWNIMRISTQDIHTIVLWLVEGFELHYGSHPNLFSEGAQSWKLPPTLDINSLCHILLGARWTVQKFFCILNVNFVSDHCKIILNNHSESNGEY